MPDIRPHRNYHITPFIGDVKLAELTPAGALDFRNLLISIGRSAVMAKKVMTSLGATLAIAIATGQVARNVVREQARQQVCVVLSTAEREQLAAIVADRNRPMRWCCRSMKRARSKRTTAPSPDCRSSRGAARP